MNRAVFTLGNTADIDSQKYIASEFHKILDKYNYVNEIHIQLNIQKTN